MDSKQATKLLWDLAHVNTQMVHSNALAVPKTYLAREHRTIKALLTALLNRAPTDQEMDQATFK